MPRALAALEMLPWQLSMAAWMALASRLSRLTSAKTRCAGSPAWRHSYDRKTASQSSNVLDQDAFCLSPVQDGDATSCPEMEHSAGSCPCGPPAPPPFKAHKWRARPRQRQTKGWILRIQSRTCAFSCKACFFLCRGPWRPWKCCRGSSRWRPGWLWLPDFLD